MNIWNDIYMYLRLCENAGINERLSTNAMDRNVFIGLCQGVADIVDEVTRCENEVLWDEIPMRVYERLCEPLTNQLLDNVDVYRKAYEDAVKKGTRIVLETPLEKLGAK